MPDDSNYYARWQMQHQPPLRLEERDGTYPPEQLLQSVWLHQRLRRDQLKTLDGQPVRVLHPGFWNRAAGPDFRGAVLQFGQEPARTGDVEVDWVSGNWQAHGHVGNPAYAGVILHVVWRGTAKAGLSVPLLALEQFIDTPLAEIQQWAGSGEAREWPPELQGACHLPLAALGPKRTGDLLQQAARVRFERKARELEARAKDAGWEQALWEGLFRALGYKQNIWPMQRLGELLPRLQPLGGSFAAWQARLLGVAGLLPSDIAGGESEIYLRGLWDHWWRERETLDGLILPRSLWRFNGLRPANQPQRRLALAAHWVSRKDFVANLEKWFADEKAETSAPDSLLACLHVPEDNFWSWHWGLRTARLTQPQPLLGVSRVTDLAVNVILPWFWIRAQAGHNTTLADVAWKRFLEWPEAQDNSLLRLARRRMLGHENDSLTNSAARQQGLLQIIHDFCDHSNAICSNCHFPDLVREFA